MKKLNLGTGALVGALLTAPLIGVMYLADQLGGIRRLGAVDLDPHPGRAPGADRAPHRPSAPGQERGQPPHPH